MRAKPVTTEDAVSTTLPLKLIDRSPTNPRKTFAQGPLEELAQSIREVGVLQPILVRPFKERYQLVCGERRFRASTIAGLAEVPAIIRLLSDEEVLVAQVVENSQREDVPPLEELDGYLALIDTGHWDAAAIAAKVGRSERYVTERLRLKDLIPEVYAALEKEEIAFSHAALLARQSADVQKEVFQRWFNGYGSRTLDNLKNALRWSRPTINDAAFDTSDDTLHPVAGACSDCPKRTKNSMFEEDHDRDQCMDPKCFQIKIAAHVERVKKAGVLPVANLYAEYELAKAIRPSSDLDLCEGQSNEWVTGYEESDIDIEKARPERIEDIGFDVDELEHTPFEVAQILAGAQARWDYETKLAAEEPVYPEGAIQVVVTEGRDAGQVRMVVKRGTSAQGPSKWEIERQERLAANKAETEFRLAVLKAAVEKAPQVPGMVIGTDGSPKPNGDVWDRLAVISVLEVLVEMLQKTDAADKSIKDDLAASKNPLQVLIGLILSKHARVSEYGQSVEFCRDQYEAIAQKVGLDVSLLRNEIASLEASK